MKLLAAELAVWNWALTCLVPNSIACASASEALLPISSSLYFRRLALRWSWFWTSSALSRLACRIFANVAEKLENSLASLLRLSCRAGRLAPLIAWSMAFFRLASASSAALASSYLPVTTK
jgi:hypothetical protein